MRGPGRPTSCTPEVIAACETAARLGVPLRRLHVHGGISRTTVKSWMAQGPETPGPIGEFARRIAAARSECEARCLANVHIAAKSNWTAAGWLLERSYGYVREPEPEEQPEASGDLAELLMQAGPAALRAALAKLTQAEQV